MKMTQFKDKETNVKLHDRQAFSTLMQYNLKKLFLLDACFEVWSVIKFQEKYQGKKSKEKSHNYMFIIYLHVFSVFFNADV